MRVGAIRWWGSIDEGFARTLRLCLRLLLPLLAVAPAPADGFRVYVGALSPRSVLLAWGTTDGPGNTIGRQSQSHGSALVRVGERQDQTRQNWILIEGLEPDTEYRYEVKLGANEAPKGKVRTYPERAERLSFLVIGDYGNGRRAQYRIAEQMWREFERKAATPSPVRFVLTTGDNIYADGRLGYLLRNTGDQDRHWERKFFRPYERLLRSIPFHPSPGNHDGDSSENRADLTVYLDNFFFPGSQPRRWYSLSYGGLADFFALDTTNNTEAGESGPVYLPGGQQHRWLEERLRESKARWKIPYFHHPPFTAGPHHRPNLEAVGHFCEAFARQGVKVAFSGHEHNFQYTSQQPATAGIRYVVTGAGGQQRGGRVLRRMRDASIEGWSPQTHFLSVEIEGLELRITPLSYEPVIVRNSRGSREQMPLVVRLEDSQQPGAKAVSP